MIDFAPRPYSRDVCVRSLSLYDNFSTIELKNNVSIMLIVKKADIYRLFTIGHYKTHDDEKNDVISKKDAFLFAR